MSPQLSNDYGIVGPVVLSTSFQVTSFGTAIPSNDLLSATDRFSFHFIDCPGPQPFKQLSSRNFPRGALTLRIELLVPQAV
jgi:hypothetical protein